MPNLLLSRPVAPSLRTPNRLDDYAVCGKCGCSWFEELKLSRVDKNQTVIPGQSVPRLSEVFLILKCGKCGELHEPPMVSSNAPSYKQYTAMITELDAPIEEKK